MSPQKERVGFVQFFFLFTIAVIILTQETGKGLTFAVLHKILASGRTDEHENTV